MTPEAVQRIPQPIPDPDRLYHFKKVYDTSNVNEYGTHRTPDDFQPRACIKKAFTDGCLEEIDNVETFAKKHSVEAKYVSAYLEHLKELAATAQIRSDARTIKKRDRASKPVEGYNWKGLSEEGELKKLTVGELNKYLGKYEFPMLGKKSEKVKRIQLHALNRTVEIPQSDDGSDEEIFEDIDEDIDEEIDEELDEDIDEAIDEELDEDIDDDIVISEIFEESGEGPNFLEKNDPFLTIFNSDSEDELEFFGF